MSRLPIRPLCAWLCAVLAFATRAQAPGAGAPEGVGGVATAPKLIILRSPPYVVEARPSREEREAARRERQLREEKAREEKLRRSEELARAKAERLDEVKQRKRQKSEAAAAERERQETARSEAARIGRQVEAWSAPATPEEAARYEKVTAARLGYMERQKELRRQAESDCVIRPVMSDAQIAKCREP